MAAPAVITQTVIPSGSQVVPGQVVYNIHNSTTTTHSSGKGNLSPGEIVGIVAGVVSAVAAVIALIWTIWRRDGNRRAQGPNIPRLMVALVVQ